MFDPKRLIKLKKRNDILKKSLYIYVIISIIAICFGFIYKEIFSFITISLLITSAILFLIAKKINIEVNKMCDDVIKNE